MRGFEEQGQFGHGVAEIFQKVFFLQFSGNKLSQLCQNHIILQNKGLLYEKFSGALYEIFFSLRKNQYLGFGT